MSARFIGIGAAAIARWSIPAGDRYGAEFYGGYIGRGFGLLCKASTATIPVQKKEIPRRCGLAKGMGGRRACFPELAAVESRISERRSLSRTFP